MGTLQFVLLQLFIVVAWVEMNSGIVPGISPFDPFRWKGLVGRCHRWKASCSERLCADAPGA